MQPVSLLVWLMRLGLGWGNISNVCDVTWILKTGETFDEFLILICLPAENGSLRDQCFIVFSISPSLTLSFHWYICPSLSASTCPSLLIHPSIHPFFSTIHSFLSVSPSFDRHIYHPTISIHSFQSIIQLFQLIQFFSSIHQSNYSFHPSIIQLFFPFIHPSFSSVHHPTTLLRPSTHPPNCSFSSIQPSSNYYFPPSQPACSYSFLFIKPSSFSSIYKYIH